MTDGKQISKSIRTFIDCLSLNEEVTSFVLLETVFNRHIKPNLIIDQHVQESLLSTKILLTKLIDKIQKIELEGSESSPPKRDSLLKRKQTEEKDNFNQKINKYLIYNLSRDIWINCVKLFENFRKLIPPNETIIQGIIEISYCSFFYQ